MLFRYLGYRLILWCRDK